jgi:hypothetical protein
MAAPAAGEQGVGVNGTDFDSYKNQLEDNFYLNPFVLLLTLIGIVFPAVLPYRAFFPFHNYRQVHVAQNALPAGWNFSALKYGVVPGIPPCPILWQDVSHYWNFAGAIGVFAYLVFAFIWVHIIFVAISIMLSILVGTGVMTPEHAIRILLQQMGVNIT